MTVGVEAGAGLRLRLPQYTWPPLETRPWPPQGSHEAFAHRQVELGVEFGLGKYLLRLANAHACAQLRLRLINAEAEAEGEAEVLCTVPAMTWLHKS